MKWGDIIMRKTFNIQDKDKEVIKHLEKQPNMSQYIVSLIKSDMKKEKVFTKEHVIKIIDEYLSMKHTNVKFIKKEEFPIDAALNIINL